MTLISFPNFANAAEIITEICPSDATVGQGGYDFNLNPGPEISANIPSYIPNSSTAANGLANCTSSWASEGTNIGEGTSAHLTFDLSNINIPKCATDIEISLTTTGIPAENGWGTTLADSDGNVINNSNNAVIGLFVYGVGPGVVDTSPGGIKIIGGGDTSSSTQPTSGSYSVSWTWPIEYSDLPILNFYNFIVTTQDGFTDVIEKQYISKISYDETSCNRETTTTTNNILTTTTSVVKGEALPETGTDTNLEIILAAALISVGLVLTFYSRKKSSKDDVKETK